MVNKEKTAKIRELNDLARTAMGVASKLIQTQGFSALPGDVQSTFREKVELFNDFNHGNDPHHEHDFGSITDNNGVRVLWKIDYYDKALEYGSAEPWDASQTTRVLTLMLDSEY